MQNLEKKERISGTKEIELLFEAGESFKSYPLRVIYIQNPFESEDVNASIIISVTKKRFKSAADRNHIKRLTRESYRLNKSDLICFLKEKDLRLLIAFLYIGQKDCTFREVENAMKSALHVLKEKLS